jgi:hypothetical protein
LSRILPYPFDGEEHHDRQSSNHEQLEDMSGCALVSFSGDADDGDVAEDGRKCDERHCDWQEGAGPFHHCQ